MTLNKINEATFFLFKSEIKTDEGHLKQMREGLRNGLMKNYFSYFSTNMYCGYSNERSQ